MRIHVRPEGAELLDASGFTSFDIAAPGLDAEQARVVLGAQGCDEPDHLFVPIALVRELAGDVDQDWEAGFAAMLEFAGSHGWIDASNAHVKAHITET